jgi:ribosomal protein S18 acetylase RimI-like enzyme
MDITYADDAGALSEDQLTGFFQGWPTHPDPSAHLQVLRGSHACWLAMDADRCVGFINAISDGVFYAHIPLLEVLPDYRGQGIGKELVRRMMETLDGMYAIDVVCDESVVPFYESLGLSRCVSMVARNYNRQSAQTHPPRQSR